jgi:hypothetical protein
MLPLHAVRPHPALHAMGEASVVSSRQKATDRPTSVCVEGFMNTHSCVLAPHLKELLSQGVDGKYGRMFSDLVTPDENETMLLALSRAGSIMGGSNGGRSRNCVQ